MSILFSDLLNFPQPVVSETSFVKYALNFALFIFNMMFLHVKDEYTIGIYHIFICMLKVSIP